MRFLRPALVALAALLPGATLAESAAGIEWQPPPAWKVESQRPMRAATYSIPAQKPDSEDGELGVFFFGSGQGGSVDANLQRWIGQFEQPDGSPSEKAAKISKDKAAGIPVTFIELGGTYLASVGGPMSPVKEKKPKFRLLGAIVEAPAGSVFFKLTGPEKTVASARPAFQKMIRSIKAAAR